MRQNGGNDIRTFMMLWLPVFMLMGLIFYFSSQPYQKQDLRPRMHEVVSQEFIVKHFSQVQVPYGREVVSVKRNGPYGFLEFFIRKGAHVVLYASLGFLGLRAMMRGSSRYKMAFLVALGCFLYACSDEYHQFLTGNRTPLVIDVLLDSAASGAGILLYAGLRYARNRRHKVVWKD